MTFHFGNSFGMGSPGDKREGLETEGKEGFLEEEDFVCGRLAKATTLLGSHTEVSSLYLP